MSRLISGGQVLVFAAGLACGATACGQTPPVPQALILKSLDIGSDWDQSDPIPLLAPVVFDEAGSNVRDAGDLYLVQQPFNLWPNRPAPFETGPVGAGAIITYKGDDAPAVWTSRPFNLNTPGQPGPSQIGSGTYVNDPLVFAQYRQYFDLDAEDQINFDVFEINPKPVPIQLPAGSRDPAWQDQHGIYFRPGYVYFSYDEDTPGGWYITGSVPNNSGPRLDAEIYVDRLRLVPGPPVPPQAWAMENNLGLGKLPSEEHIDAKYNDDVDALDMHPVKTSNPQEPLVKYRYRFYSVDHEASMGLDAGDIYATIDDLMVGAVNQVKVFDKMVHLGVPGLATQPGFDTDIDAFEFVSVSPEDYQAMFAMPAPGQSDMLIALFSVAADDPDTMTVNESGGLLPNVIYASNLAGIYVPISGPYEYNIDAISVIPEPGYVLGALLLMMLARRPRR